MKGDNENEENPFSFKKFLNTPTQNNPQPPPPPLSSTASFSNKTDQDYAKKQTKSTKKTNESNPFSFKQFLNTSAETSSNILVEQPTHQESSLLDDDEVLLPPPPLPPLPILLNNRLDTSVLPDFVNETIHVDNSKSVNDDPYSVLENIPLIIDEPTQTQRSYFDLETQFLTNNADTEDETSQLPCYYDLENDLNSQIPKSKLVSSDAFNLDYYKNQLEDKQRIIDEQEKKMENLQKQLNILKQKEDFENKTLEKMILKVEKNLELTTERAIEAEKLVDKLKNENKMFKIQIQNLENENLNLKKLQNSSNNSTKQQNVMQNISCQLNGIANTAEQSFKQLMTGVDSLRLLASTIESLDKIRDVTNDVNNDA